MPRSRTRATVWAAIIGDVLVAITKTGAALVSGSSAMLSEAFHSIVDSCNEVLLLYGMNRSRRSPDEDHPYGYGRELYFWSFIVALLLFGLGGIASIMKGVAQIRNPEPVQHVGLMYLVLVLSAVFEGSSWAIARKGFRPFVGQDGYFAAILRSKDPPQFGVLLEDSAALLGIAMVAVGTWISTHWHAPAVDGYTSIAIGLLLGSISLLLARETKGLLIGERADPKLQSEVFAVARATPGIVSPNGLISVQLAPDQVIVALSLEFEPEMTTSEIEAAVAQMEAKVREVRPEVLLLYVKPQSPAGFEKARARLRGRFTKSGTAGRK